MNTTRNGAKVPADFQPEFFQRGPAELGLPWDEINAICAEIEAAANGRDGTPGPQAPEPRTTGRRAAA